MEFRQDGSRELFIEAMPDSNLEMFMVSKEEFVIQRLHSLWHGGGGKFTRSPKGVHIEFILSPQSNVIYLNDETCDEVSPPQLAEPVAAVMTSAANQYKVDASTIVKGLVARFGDGGRLEGIMANGRPFYFDIFDDNAAAKALRQMLLTKGTICSMELSWVLGWHAQEQKLYPKGMALIAKRGGTFPAGGLAVPLTYVPAPATAAKAADRWAGDLGL